MPKAIVDRGSCMESRQIPIPHRASGGSYAHAHAPAGRGYRWDTRRARLPHGRPGQSFLGNYHWARTANPFTLKLDNNVTAAWTSYLNLASSDWTASTVLNTT